MILNKEYWEYFDYLHREGIKLNMLFADLPYNVTNASWDKQPIDLQLWWEGVYKVLADDGLVVATACVPFNILLGASNLDNLKYEWIWEKTQGTGHLNSKIQPIRCHENVLIFYKKQPTYNPQKTKGHKRKVATAKHKRNTDTGELYNKCDSFSDYDSTERYPRTVLTFKSDKQKLNIHSTQKPLALLEYFIKTYTNEGDIIGDSTCGSGGIKVASENLGRKAIINDNDPYWCEVSRLRSEEGWDKTPPNKKQLKQRLKQLKEKIKENSHI